MPEIGNILNDIISTFKKIDALWFDTHLDFIGTFDKLTEKKILDSMGYFAYQMVLRKFWNTQ